MTNDLGRFTVQHPGMLICIHTQTGDVYLVAHTCEEDGCHGGHHVNWQVCPVCPPSPFYVTLTDTQHAVLTSLYLTFNKDIFM